MQYKDLAEWSERAGKWAESYFATLRERPVRPHMVPGDFAKQIPAHAPDDPEKIETIFADFDRLVPGAMTHWQHPRFFAYFPASVAPASMLADYLANAMGCNTMLWQTSPAGTELEVRMIDWMRDAFGLPAKFTGLLQEGASSSTLCAILTMRERALAWKGLEDGLRPHPKLRVYASPENHSSIDKAVRIAGIGQSNLVKVPTRADRSLDTDALREAIKADRHSGCIPAGLVLCVGGTATGSCDNIEDAISVAKEFDLYTHVDAAWAGAAMLCPEYREIWQGVDDADSIVVNAHKWLGASIGCSIQFLADKSLQLRTLGLRPDYLKSENVHEVINLNEMSVALGRRFLALKLWFVVRAYGLSGLRELVRNQIGWVRELESLFLADPDFEVPISNPLAFFAFRYAVPGRDKGKLTDELARRINDDGRTYLTETVVDGTPAIRVAAGNFECTRDDVLSVYRIAKELAETIGRSGRTIR